MKQHLVFFLCLIIQMISAQQSTSVDFKHAQIALSEFNTESKQFEARVDYTFDILTSVDSLFLDARNIRVTKLLVNNKTVDYKLSNNKLWIIRALPLSKSNKLQINFVAKPKKAMYFVGWDNAGSNQIWTQGQGKYTSNWLPSVDDMTDKIEFDLSISFDKNYEVIANGKLIKTEDQDSIKVWHYDMQQPMSSYLLAFAIGKYEKKKTASESGIPLEMYYAAEDSLRVEPTYRHTKMMFDYLEAEIGVPYPWQNYKQIPVKDFLYAGMENTGTTIFSDALMIDSIAFVDKNYVNVNAHELAHQWFGDLVTETEGTHHWLQEGFATYYALMAERKVFGNAYYYWTLYDYAEELKAQEKAGQATALLNPKSSSTTFYKKGAWLLYMLRHNIGDQAFKEAVKSYLTQHQYKNVSSDDFFAEVEKASTMDLSQFKETWLRSKELPYDEMLGQLSAESASINSYLQMDCQNSEEACKALLIAADNALLKQRLIAQLGGDIPHSTFKNKNIKVRQAIAEHLNPIPLALKADYETLLGDKSYITKETALFQLVNQFPKEAKKYLKQTKSAIGFKNRNIRQLWLFLALATGVYNQAASQEYYKELLSYTSPAHHFETRELAFQYLNALGACKQGACLEHLKEAAKHHNWRFKKMAKQLLKEQQ